MVEVAPHRHGAQASARVDGHHARFLVHGHDRARDLALRARRRVGLQGGYGSNQYDPLGRFFRTGIRFNF